MIGDYRIYCDMDAMDIMDCLSYSQEVDFMYECYKCLSPLKHGDFFEKLGATEVIESLGEDNIVKELQSRGYKITKDGSDDI